MPRIPNAPREGHPGKPPRRRKDQGAEGAERGAPRSRRAPRSYGQSAPMPEADEQHGKVEHEHESLEDLAGEPVREEGEDEPGKPPS
jgi:hypothetical protein